MDRASMNLSTDLEDSSESDGGRIGGKAKDRKSLVAEQGGLAEREGQGERGEKRGEKNKRSVQKVSEQGERAKRRSVFGSLRGTASALRASARKSADDEGKAKLKNRLKIVANDKPVGGVADIQEGKSVKDEASESKPASAEPDTVAEGDYLVHPAHGVGYVRGVEAEEVAGARMDMIAISFEQERMIVRVPTCEYENCGLRSVSSPEAMEGIYDTLKTKRRIRKTMWGRRAQEYDNKIRSGDPVRLAQVVRELYRGEEQPSPSYSERQYYQLALERLSREVAVVEKIEESLAVEKLETILAAA